MSVIDPFHARHSIAVTVVMYHMTYEWWRSSKKTGSCDIPMMLCHCNGLVSLLCRVVFLTAIHFALIHLKGVYWGELNPALSFQLGHKMLLLTKNEKSEVSEK